MLKRPRNARNTEAVMVEWCSNGFIDMCLAFSLMYRAGTASAVTAAAVERRCQRVNGIASEKQVASPFNVWGYHPSQLPKFVQIS